MIYLTPGLVDDLQCSHLWTQERMKLHVQSLVHQVSSCAPKVGALMKLICVMVMMTVVKLMMRLMSCVDVTVNSINVSMVVDVSVPGSVVMVDINALIGRTSGTVLASTLITLFKSGTCQ